MAQQPASVTSDLPVRKESIELEIYRKEALEHLDSPEQLDTLMKVTEPRRWFALVGVCLLILVSMGWAFLGRIPVLVSGEGGIFSKGGARIVYAPVVGRLEAFNLQAGQTVTAGQPIGSIVPFDGGPAKPILSPGNGEVVEILADVWAPLDPTVPIFKLADNSGPLWVILFLTPAEGAEVRAGMEVQVFPKIAGQSEYGHILGRVKEVAHYPWSSGGLTNILENSSEVDYLVGKGLLLPVLVTLEESSDGYRWSGAKSGAGLPELYSGLLCTAKIVVAEKTPVSLILGSH